MHLIPPSGDLKKESQDSAGKPPETLPNPEELALNPNCFYPTDTPCAMGEGMSQLVGSIWGDGMGNITLQQSHCWLMGLWMMGVAE